MNEDSKINALIHISKTHRAEARYRSTVEWKVVFTTLTFDALASTAVLSEKIPAPFEFKCCIILVLFFVMIIAIWYLRILHKRSHKNKLSADIAEQELTDIVNSKSLKLYENQEIGKNRLLWAWWLQMVIILLFSISACIIIGLQNKTGY